MSSPSRAAGALRHLRTAAGLSQQQLSWRSGVSERTIRGLESGSIRAPQRATVRALAASLGLRGGEVDALVGAWRDTDRLPVGLAEILQRDELGFELSADLAAQPDRLREITRLYQTTIDERGLLASVRVHRTFEVLDDGLDRIIWAQGYDAFALDPLEVGIVGLANCRAGRRIVVEPGLQVHELLLGVSLPRQARCAVEYEVDFRPAYRFDETPPKPEVESLTGWPSSGGAVSIVQTQFDSRRPPARVWSVRQRGLGHERAAVTRQIELSPFHCAEDLVERPSPGTHGLRWAWE